MVSLCSTKSSWKEIVFESLENWLWKVLSMSALEAPLVLMESRSPMCSNMELSKARKGEKTSDRKEVSQMKEE